MRDRWPILTALAILIACLTTPVWYGALANTGRAAPIIPAATGTHCVRPVAWMRKNHMTLLMQLRDEAVHEGMRSKEESLPGCMSCHVSRLADGSYPAPTSKKFFCNACHAYAGVSIDCFSCHSNRPDGADGADSAQAAEAGRAPLFAAGEAAAALRTATAAEASPAARAAGGAP